MPDAERNKPDVYPPPNPRRDREELNRVWFEGVRKRRLAIHDSLVDISEGGIQKIRERLDRGDPIIDHTGKVIGYRPPRLRDLDSVVAMAIDRQIDLEKRILGIDEEGNPPTNDKVQALLVRLELVSRETPINGEVRGDYREPRVIDADDA